MCNELLSDLTAYSNVDVEIQNAIEEMHTLESELFSNWYVKLVQKRKTIRYLRILLRDSLGTLVSSLANR